MAIQIQGFYLIEVKRQNPNVQVVVKEGVILDVDLECMARGITAGMPLKKARALVEGLQTYNYSPDEFVDARANWLEKLVLYTGKIEVVADHYAVLDLSQHPQPVEIASHLAHSLKESYEVRWGGADTRWVAELSCRLGCGHISDGQAFIAQFPVSCLPVSTQAQNRLNFLGFRTVESLLDLSLERLREQFDEEGHVLYHAIRCRWNGEVERNYPKESLSAYHNFGGSLESEEQLQSAFHCLANELGGLISTLDKQCYRLMMVWELENFQHIVHKRTYQKPLYNLLTILSALRLLYNKAKAPETCIGIRVLLLDLLPLQSKQTVLPVVQSRPKDNPGFERALEGIKGAFGAEIICKASEVSQERRKKVLMEWKHATGWV